MKISAREIANFTDGYILSGEPETIFAGVSKNSLMNRSRAELIWE